MIINGKVVKVISVELGNLGLHNASSFYVNKDPKNYPMAWFGKKTKQGKSLNIYPEKPEDCPKGYYIDRQYDNPMERLLDYANSIKEEHKDLSDMQIKANPPFIGRKRCARWIDEQYRRGLTN